LHDFRALVPILRVAALDIIRHLLHVILPLELSLQCELQLRTGVDFQTRQISEHRRGLVGREIT
jgi:hypothetical protein